MKVLEWLFRLLMAAIFSIAGVLSVVLLFPAFSWNAILKFFDSTAESHN